MSICSHVIRSCRFKKQSMTSIMATTNNLHKNNYNTQNINGDIIIIIINIIIIIIIITLIIVIVIILLVLQLTLSLISISIIRISP